MAIAIIAIAVTSSAIIRNAIINIATNVDPKSVPVKAPGHPSSTQNRPREPFGTP